MWMGTPRMTSRNMPFGIEPGVRSGGYSGRVRCWSQIMQFWWIWLRSRSSILASLFCLLVRFLLVFRLLSHDRIAVLRLQLFSSPEAAS